MGNYLEMAAVAVVVNALIAGAFVMLACIDKVRGWALNKLMRRLVG